MLCVMSCYLQCHILNWANWQVLLLQGTQRCRPLGPSTSAGSISKQGESGKIRAEMIWTISKKLKKHAPIFYNKLYAPTAMGQWCASQNCTLQPWKLHMVSFCIIPRQELQDSESVGLWECIAEHTVVRASTALWGLSTSSLNVHHISFRIYVVIDTTVINCKYGFRIVLLCFCFSFSSVFFSGIDHIPLTVSFCLWCVL